LRKKKIELYLLDLDIWKSIFDSHKNAFMELTVHCFLVIILKFNYFTLYVAV